MANEFLVKRVVQANMNMTAGQVASASSFIPTSVFVPSGAIVTGATLIHTATGAANTLAVNAAASNTFCLYVSTDIPLIAITALTDITSVAGQTIPWRAALLTTAGMYISKGGPIYFKQGISNGSAAWTYNPDVYVGYIMN
jgi:hypothetical protein